MLYCLQTFTFVFCFNICVFTCVQIMAYLWNVQTMYWLIDWHIHPIISTEAWLYLNRAFNGHLWNRVYIWLFYKVYHAQNTYQDLFLWKLQGFLLLHNQARCKRLQQIHCNTVTITLFNIRFVSSKGWYSILFYQELLPL